MRKFKKTKMLLTAAVCALLLAGCGRNDSQIVWEETAAFRSGSQETEQIQVSERVTETETEQTLLAVDISGAVVHPGVYYLVRGSRICDAVKLAGGLLAEADRDTLNQAELLQDGSKIRVYTVQEAETAAFAGVSGMNSEQSAKVNINTADIGQLCTLSGIGESRAKDIIAYREQNGPFLAIEDIMNVSGIKEATFNKIKEQIAIG